MPTSGLTLIGFFDKQDQVLQFMRTTCVPGAKSDSDLLMEWIAAKANLGSPTSRAGKPEILPIPQDLEDHINALSLLPQIANLLANGLAGAEFKMVEIDPLLAFQFSIDVDRSNHHCHAFSNPPSNKELANACLPLAPTTENIQVSQTNQSVIIKARGLNLNVFAQGLAHNFAGLNFGFSLPLMHVVRHNQRCYLHNGFHRAYGARKAGATHVPCIFRDVQDHQNVGIKADGSTFAAALLESSNPPTLAHYTQGRAHSAQMRALSRVLHVSWAEYILPDE